MKSYYDLSVQRSPDIDWWVNAYNDVEAGISFDTKIRYHSDILKHINYHRYGLWAKIDGMEYALLMLEVGADPACVREVEQKIKKTKDESKSWDKVWAAIMDLPLGATEQVAVSAMNLLDQLTQRA